MKYFIDEEEQELSDVSQGDSRKTQEDLNRMIGMNPKMFKHIVALNTYTQPFLSLHANEQQDIIEQLLGIQLLSEKAEILKTHIKSTKEDIALETARLEGIKISNEKVEETIHSLQNKSSAWQLIAPYSSKLYQALELSNKELSKSKLEKQFCTSSLSSKSSFNLIKRFNSSTLSILTVMLGFQIIDAFSISMFLSLIDRFHDRFSIIHLVYRLYNFLLPLIDRF